MEAQVYQQMIAEGIKTLPPELLSEVADFVYLLRKRVQDPQAFAAEQRDFLLSAELIQLSRDETRHLEEEFADYERLYPRH